MDFKALIFDLDGTAIEAKLDAMPSKAVVEAVKLAKERIIVSIATGRPIADGRDIIHALGIDQPCIVAGGTQLIDPATEEIIWEKKISKENVRKVLNIGKKYQQKVLLGEGLKAKKTERNENEEKNVLYMLNVTPNVAKNIYKEIGEIPELQAHEAGSWTPGLEDIHITHKEATKKNAMIEWAKLLKLRRENIIAVGDRSNDLPLFEMAGYKIAVANAVDELKSKADFIAPSVYEDGLVLVINKFILKK